MSLDTLQNNQVALAPVAQPIQLSFVKSATDLSGAPADSLPEVAMVGRSNSGKSSFLNAIGHQKIAKVSGVPGKTRTLNFFLQKSGFRWVDMPGYGFASRGKAEIKSWQVMIEEFLIGRENLCGLILIMDIRRDWRAEEEMILEFCQKAGLPLSLVLNKSDKISRGKAAQARQKMIRDLGFQNVFVTSCLNRNGVKETEDFVYKKWIQNFSMTEELVES